MGFGKFLGKVAGDITNSLKEANEERKRRIKIEQDRKRKERAQWEKQYAEIEKLLDKFEIPMLQKFCENVLGRLPQGDVEEYDDKSTGEKIVEEYDPAREHYIDFIWVYLKDGKLKFTQIKDFALKNRIVAPSFFGDSENSSSSQLNDFEIIINSIVAQFEPERIDSEEHLQAQVTIFLKAKFPTKKIEREVLTKRGDKLDIVIDGKYVFELKVPQDRTSLRNLSAQLEEYKEEYPDICAIIFDDESKNLTSEIKEYIDKYKRSLGIHSVILRGRKQG